MHIDIVWMGFIVVLEKMDGFIRLLIADEFLSLFKNGFGGESNSPK